ncbi:MAG TPA: choice-of-anchor tandem repeat GloVer-containing protein [Candidatus Solibacter sp.]|nr:choice-of-anchor tandem repeat GloVer-containing protein [Candidatus Solibacter sp.]
MTILKSFLMAVLCLAATAISSPAQTLTTLLNFNGANGASPYASLIQAADGNFYGTTSTGGTSSACTNGCGTVFQVTPAGALTTLHSFSGTDGEFPIAKLVEATDGNFYGTTAFGGSSTNCASGCGTIFMITPAGTLSTLHNFVGTDGNGPNAALIQAADGNLYGITSYGGTNTCTSTPGCGTIFKITLSGALTTLYNFSGSDGRNPYGGLVQAKNGKFYGTTQFGGANNGCGTFIGCGTAFSMTRSGALTTLLSFCAQSGCSDGAVPQTQLVQGTDGRFYGTTYSGGINSFGTVFSFSAAGGLRTLHRFIGNDGFDPQELLAAADGNFYGGATFGGNSSCPSGCGTVFKITARGVMTSLHRFHGKDGSNPFGGMLQATSGELYGTTSFAGANGDGTFFSLTVP